MTLREHMRERHLRVGRLARSNEDLAKQHAEQHWRYRCNHHHGVTSSANDRPEGWRTGGNVQEWKARNPK